MFGVLKLATCSNPVVVELPVARACSGYLTSFELQRSKLHNYQQL